MSFLTDIKDLMKGASHTQLNGKIVYGNLPDNININYNNVSYTYSLGNNENNFYEVYNLIIGIYSKNIESIPIISDYLKSYIDGITYNEIDDISFTSESNVEYYEDIGVYGSKLNFVCDFFG